MYMYNKSDLELLPRTDSTSGLRTGPRTDSPVARRLQLRTQYRSTLPLPPSPGPVLPTQLPRTTDGPETSPALEPTARAECVSCPLPPDTHDVTVIQSSASTYFVVQRKNPNFGLLRGLQDLTSCSH